MLTLGDTIVVLLALCAASVAMPCVVVVLGAHAGVRRFKTDPERDQIAARIIDAIKLDKLTRRL